MTPPKNDELMPEEIWAGERKNGSVYWHVMKKDSAGDTLYIRADIAAQGEDGGWNFDMDACPKQGIVLVTNGRGTWPSRWAGGAEGDGYYELMFQYGKINGCIAWQPLPAPTRAEIDEAIDFMQGCISTDHVDYIMYRNTLIQASKSGTSMTAEELGAAICAGFDSGYKKALMDSAKSGGVRFSREEMSLAIASKWAERANKAFRAGNMYTAENVINSSLDALIELGVVEVKS